MLPLVALLGCAPDTFTGADAAPDAQPNDGGGGGDVAITDGPTGGDAIGVDGGPDLSCNNVLSGTVLCDDFDTPNASGPAQKWSGQLAVNGNNSFDTSVFHSPPRSYRASIQAADGGAFADSALLIQSLTTTSLAGVTLTTHAYARIHAIDPNQAIGLLEVSYVPNTGATSRVWAAIIADNDKLNLVVQGDGTSVTATQQLTDVALDTWVYLQIDMIPSQSKVLAMVDTAQTAVSTPLADAAASPLPEVDLGLLNASTDYASVANYDNFLFRIH